MKTPLVIIFLLFLSTHLSGQRRTIIQGQIIDAETDKPLPYANIVYEPKSIGTAADGKGMFAIDVFDLRDTDKLSFSFIGYETKKMTIDEIRSQKTIALMPKQIALDEITISPDKLDADDYMKKVIKQYNANRLDTPHIAVAHYREKAKKDGKYIMFMESIGYSVYAGDLSNVAVLATYNFFCKNTRMHVTHPEWLEYGSNIPSPPGEISKVFSSAGSNLNFMRWLEISSLLSNEDYDDFDFQLDSTFYNNNSMVYSISFEDRKTNGSIHVRRDNNQILYLDFDGRGFWSTPFYKRVRSNIQIRFNNFDETPFVSSIISTYEKKGLSHTVELHVLIQKFADFTMTANESLSFSELSHEPFIEYNPKEWEQKNISPINDYQIIEADLLGGEGSLEDHFMANSGTWFHGAEGGSERARKKIQELEESF